MANSEQLVLVSGVTGFIAQHCVRELLERGYSVRGTMRSLAREAEVREALSVVPGATTTDNMPGRLEFVETDLTRDDGWDSAVAGCDYVLHLASPLPLEEPKDENELIIPAREGVLRVLKAAADAGTVKRVVMTSSIAAIVHGHNDVHNDVHNGAHNEHRTLTEDDWTDVEKCGLAYPKSKTLAERAAWDFMAALAPKADGQRAMELAVINPGLVLGPVLSGDPSVSLEVIRKMLAREVPGLPRLGWAPVDVRDIAWLHVEAMTNPDAAGKRFIGAIEHAWMADYAKILKDNGFKVATMVLPDFVVRLVGLFDPTVRMVLPELGMREDLDNSRAREILGWKPRGLEEMVVAAAKSLQEQGVV